MGDGTHQLMLGSWILEWEGQLGGAVGCAGGAASNIAMQMNQVNLSYLIDDLGYGSDAWDVWRIIRYLR